MSALRRGNANTINDQRICMNNDDGNRGFEEKGPLPAYDSENPPGQGYVPLENKCFLFFEMLESIPVK